MPAVTDNGLSAVIGFALPPWRLDHDDGIYLQRWDPKAMRPNEKIRVPMTDLRPEIDSPELPSIASQLHDRGFAIFKHRSDLIDQIQSEEGTQAYLDESAELLRSALGCTKVIAWNSVVRRNDPEVKEKIVPLQPGPEKDFVPTSRTQPVAGVAHVDQNETWGYELCGKAAGRSADDFKRVMIVNLWRPLHGPVTNAPLAMLDYHDIDPKNVHHGKSQYGIGMSISHTSAQRWGYVRHQTTDEGILLKCYDSDQGKDGSAKYCGHVACVVDGDAEGIDPALVKPRESIEVRLVALWE
jgi:hypothetical protein